MNWASIVSDQPSLEKAIEDCVAHIRRELNERDPDLSVIFVSAHHADYYDQVPAMVLERLKTKVLFGCSAGGVIGGGQEVEHRPGFSITAAHLPDVELIPFHVETPSLPDLDAPPQVWEQMVEVTADKNPHFLLLTDPYTFHAENLLLGLDYAFPRSAKIGGLASGADRGRANTLYLGDKALHSGSIGIAMCGNITVDTIVAQGCRPVGKPLHITKCRHNILIELDARPPLEVLRELFQTLSSRDRELFRHSLFLGIVMDEFQEEYRQGDFLIRNIVGIDPSNGALAIGEILREGQVAQFHLRDALTSAEDLQALLSRYAKDRAEDKPQGAILFSCLGRGMYLYGRPNHDTDLFRNFVGNIPLGGFFCNGEIGPVRGTTYLHGYTSSFGLFRPMVKNEEEN